MNEDTKVNEKEIRRLDDLFNVALVFITVLGAAEFGFATVAAKNIGDLKYYFWIFTYPVAILILAWILKGLISGNVELPQDASKVARALRNANFTRDFVIFLTEFCWFFWATLLYFFLNFYLFLVTGNINLLLTISTGFIYLVLLYEILIAFVRALGRSYYTRHKTYTAIALLVSIFLMIFLTQII
jgi:hypothetical protein